MDFKKLERFPKKTRQKGGNDGTKDRLVVNFPAGKDANGRNLYQRIYLGLWEDKSAHSEYDRMRAEWILQTKGDEKPAIPKFYRTEKEQEITIAELVERFLEDAKFRYVKHNRSTGTFERYVRNARPLIEFFRSYRVSEFGYEELKQIQNYLDRNPKLCREYVNKKIDNIKSIFRWGRENRIVPREVIADIELVKSLRRGRCRSVDHAPVRSVPDCDITAILKYLSPTLEAMVTLQRATGWRPEEVRILKLSDIDRSKTPWEYRPESFKTEHIQNERTLKVGPAARRIISEYARRSQRDEFDHSEYLFRPEDSRRWYLKQRITRPGSKTIAGEEYEYNDREYYSRDSYARAVRTACNRAKVKPFTPYQIRHSKATEIERLEGLKGVQAVLGHTNPTTSQRYVDPDTELADRLAEDFG